MTAQGEVEQETSSLVCAAEGCVWYDSVKVIRFYHPEPLAAAATADVRFPLPLLGGLFCLFWPSKQIPSTSPEAGKQNQSLDPEMGQECAKGTGAPTEPVPCQLLPREVSL